MQDDAMKRLKSAAVGNAPAFTGDIEWALAEIERLRQLLRGEASDVSARRPPTSFDELEARVAMLESSTRRTGYRIDAAAAAMKDVASRESLHHAVRYVADNLRIAFIGTPADEEEVDGHG